jgi:hypothetical protein
MAFRRPAGRRCVVIRRAEVYVQTETVYAWVGSERSSWKWQLRPMIDDRLVVSSQRDVMARY